ncbi:type II toxin-antitoxin system PemK/MazF family toxin [Desulfofundulus thermocisternus]|jgi:mRNA interferase MazF|uniref:type II toxin-antitoxin system PemK/MazF family toxin n=1 Tax=Desulfofundulus thermocisternus TaxID=42471 RepID=UPI00217F22BF|nr:type II toxin-antitoxin system PemK/MazF family toxin [Desulfofundulus thermocisternus]MCS5697329.1 type II toxin-antitoxin system PemK/MazF family toxin [Desulfofundulus thermocisternus]MDK2889356.1 mRNA interferase MazF [Thermoanaerobacter sp.]
MEIKRGDVFLVDFNPARGSEQAGFRPAVVVQNNVGNRYSPTVIVAAITTAVSKVYPFLVRLKAGEGGLEKESAVNTAQVLTIDKSRLVKKLGGLPKEKMSEVDRALKISLGLE